MSKNLHPLARISQYMNIHTQRMTMKAFIASAFGYCPPVWLFRSSKLNSRVNKLQERALRIVYQDYASSFTKILEKGNPTTIHNRNIQLLATELFKVKNELLPSSRKLFSWFFITCLLIFHVVYFIMFKSHFYFVNFKSVLSFIAIF